MPRSWIIGDPPDTANLLMAGGTGLWSCTPAHFHWHYECQETIFIFSGCARIRDVADGIWHSVGPGDSVVFPAGAVAEWVITDTIVKFFVMGRPSIAQILVMKIKRILDKR